jgi:hypothetical protein
MNGRPSGALLRALPLLALLAALFGSWLTPPPAALAGIGAWTADQPAFDATDSVDRTAVKPTPPSQLRAAKTKSPDTSHGSPPAPASIAADRVNVATVVGRIELVDLARIDLPKRPASTAQPRAPPPSRT